MMRFGLFVAVGVVSVAVAWSAVAAEKSTLPSGYLAVDQSQAILDKTFHVHLAPDVSRLTVRERATVDLLVEVGTIIERLHESMRHHQALSARARLLDLDHELGSPAATQNLLVLYYMGSGPIVRMLDNVRRPVLPVDPAVPGGTVYPWGVTKGEIDAFLAAHPDARASILAPRTAVRRADRASLKKDLAALSKYPALGALHPGLQTALESAARRPDTKAFYAVPYSVAFADELVSVHALLTRAAETIEPEDKDFAAYLGNRARDLLSDDYESGDASWVSGRFHTLNAQIGSYETYDDELYGSKTYFGCCVLIVDRPRSDALRTATAELQRFEDSLPYQEGKPHKRVRTDIPVGAYDVAADFGQSRGTNTASILPNDADMARKYGRTILLRRNILTDPGLFEISLESYRVAVSDKFANDLTADAGFQRTLWHEVGHYLGVDRTRDGRDLDIALEQASGIYEEMKADLVSLFIAPQLEKMGYYDAAARRSLYAAGVRRVLPKNRPDRAQVYQTMELMQWNYYLAHGALSFDGASGRLVIHYDRFHDAVAQMLREVLEIQAAGDRPAAEAYITKWTEWRDDLHERVAAAMRATESYRYAYVTCELVDGPTE